jgi:hypothetical protein
MHMLTSHLHSYVFTYLLSHISHLPTTCQHVCASHTSPFPSTLPFLTSYVSLNMSPSALQMTFHLYTPESGYCAQVTPGHTKQSSIPISTTTQHHITVYLNPGIVHSSLPDIPGSVVFQFQLLPCSTYNLFTFTFTFCTTTIACY